MSWSNAVLLSASIFLSSGIAHAEKINCPETLKENNKTYIMNYVSLFMGPPEEKADVMPDTLDAWVWTLKDYQDYVKEHNTSLFLVCGYKGTDKTTIIKVPADAKKCSAHYGKKEAVLATCE